MLETMNAKRYLIFFSPFFIKKFSLRWPINCLFTKVDFRLLPFLVSLFRTSVHYRTTRRFDENKCLFKHFFTIYLTNRFQVAVRPFSNRSQMTSKRGKNKKVAHEAQPSVSLMFLPRFDVLCDLESICFI